MSMAPNSPRLIKGGIVLLDPDTGAIQRIIALQYNPDTLTRSLQVQSVEAGNRNRSEAMRLKGPPIETFKLEAEIDATDQLEVPDQNPNSRQFGLHPQIAALETIVYPTSTQLLNMNSQAQSGTLEIAPLESPLTLFIWSSSRVVPVRITDFSITEEAFDTSLNPIRAKVSLGLRVMSTDDFGFTHRGGTIFISYLRAREALATKAGSASLASIGLSGLP